MTAIIDIGTLVVRTPDTCGDRASTPNISTVNKLQTFTIE